MRDLLRLLRLGRSARSVFALGALLALVVVLANVALLGLAGWFIAAMAAAGLVGVAMNYFTASAGIRAFAITRTAGRYLERLVNHNATLKLLSRLRVWVYLRIRPLSPGILDRYRKGDVLTRLVGNINVLDNAWLRIFSPVFVALCAGTAMFVFLLFYSVPVAWVDLALLGCIGVALPAFTQHRGRRAAARAAAINGEMKADLTETFAGLAELEVLGAAPACRAQHARYNHGLAHEQDRGLALEATAAGWTVALTGIAIALAWLLGARMVGAGKLSPLMLPLLIFVVLASVEAVQALPAAFRALGDTLAAAGRVFSLADEEPAVVEMPGATRVANGYALEFQDVSFRYAAGSKRVLDDVSFGVPEGAAIAIVGPSGAGKSSIIQLAMRFYDAEGGAIRLDGKRLDVYALDIARTQFAWAPQSTRLFSTTIRENLRLAAPRATDADLWRALEAAAFAEEVRQLDGGLERFVGAGGMALSAGQARRLALARAWLSAAPVLLLDEPTEGLDTATARTVVDHFVGHRGARSLVWITHQAMGLELMDEILVVDDGRIVERGTHDELLAAGAFYRRMACGLI
ncbi:MAG: thiol reductant ABC exporter subunit CydC [Rhodanobacteraceae bacterium]